LSLLDILDELAKHRPIFHSEADFQHALAWGIQKAHPEYSIRLEYPIAISRKHIHVDIIVLFQGETIAIELKYFKHYLNINIDDEHFTLKNHAADDVCRYNFLYDVQRLEELTSQRNNCSGIAILLTNAPLLWTPPATHTTLQNDIQFRLHEGITLQGTLSWGKAYSPDTPGSQPITLRNSYHTRWIPYSQIADERGGTFQYLLFSITK